MSDLVNEGKVAVAELLTEGSGGTVRLRLFKSSFVPTPDTVLSDLDECDFAGYAPKTIDDWEPVEENPEGTAVTATMLQTWTKLVGTDNEVHGHALTLEVNGQSERLLDPKPYAVPYQMNEVGKALPVRATILIVPQG